MASTADYVTNAIKEFTNVIYVPSMPWEVHSALHVKTRFILTSISAKLVSIYLIIATNAHPPNVSSVSLLIRLEQITDAVNVLPVTG